MRKSLLAALISALPLCAQVDIHAVGEDHIAIQIDGKPFSDFYLGPKYPKPFLAPLRSADGTIVTRQFPMKEVAGESRDHPHHRGLWIGYGDISGVNFWENEFTYTSNNRGLIKLQHLDGLKSGKRTGSLSATFYWLSPQGTPMLEEHRSMTFSHPKDLRIIDVDAAFTAKQNLTFEDTKEGFFAVRVADALAEKNGGVMRNSAGASKEKAVWGKRADWVDYSGAINGAKLGIVIFDHPANYNHPPRWHSRAYGLFAVNPFGAKQFDRASAPEGGKSLKAGEKLRFRYRVVIYSGSVSMPQIQDWYAAYRKQRN